MATKLGNRRQQRAAQDAAKPDNELEVLHPERRLVLAGKPVTVREYGHVEWLRLLPATKPLVESIAAMLEAGRAPSYEDALEVLALHTDGLMPLVRQACDMPTEAFNALDPEDGELLLMTWWGVNGRFFVQRALNRVAVSGFERQAGLSATARSTPPSSTTATPETTSDASPSGS
jgi:hypothetical protein